MGMEKKGKDEIAMISAAASGQIILAPKLFTLAELKSATRNFKPNTVLGEGGFGRVFKGWVDEKTYAPAKVGTGMAVAVKKSSPESSQGLEEWQVIPPPPSNPPPPPPLSLSFPHSFYHRLKLFSDIGLDKHDNPNLICFQKFILGRVHASCCLSIDLHMTFTLTSQIFI